MSDSYDFCPSCGAPIKQSTYDEKALRDQLKQLPIERLEPMKRAGPKIERWHSIMSKTRGNIIADVLNHQGAFYEMKHYPSGDVYDVRNDLPIKTIFYEEFIGVFGKFINQTAKANITPVELTAEDEKIITVIKDKWKEGDRQNLTLSLAGYLRKQKRFGFDRAANIVQKICEEMGDEDINERLKAVKETYMKDENQVKGITGLVERNVTVEKRIEDFLIIKYSEKTGEEISRKVDIDAVADHLISTHEFKTWFGTKSDYSFNFDGRKMNKDTRGIVKCDCEKLLENYCKKNIVEEVFEKVKRKTKVDREEFEYNETNFINLKNGVWDIKEKKLFPHDSKYNFTHIIEIAKDDNPLNIHRCTNWLRFIGETFYPEDIPVLQEWFGFLLFREYFLKKAVIGVGPQNSGKSVVLDTAIKFIGEKNKTGLSLHKISSGSDFTKLSLKDKHLNAYDDLSSADINDGGAFKVATGGGYISGEERFGEYQQFRSYAKIMLMANKIPPVKDNDDLAYFGRFIIFKLDNIPDKLDPFLRQKLWTDTELSGILNWALEGLYRILEAGSFSYTKTPQDIKQLMEHSGCPLVAFSSEVLEKEDGAIISKDDMFKVYSKWCEESKKPRLSKEMLGRRLTKYCPYILAEKHKIRIWKNAKLSSKWKNWFENQQNDMITDTSDTSQNNMRKYLESDKSSSKIDNIISEKVSEEPPKSPQETGGLNG